MKLNAKLSKRESPIAELLACLIAFVPRELTSFDDIFRVGRRARITRVVRAARRGSESDDSINFLNF